MAGLELQLSSGWSAAPVSIELDLAEVMAQLEPGWEDWVPPVAVAS